MASGEKIKRTTVRLAIFVGNMFPLFLIVSIIYYPSKYDICTIIITIISFFLMFYWINILRASRDPKSRNIKVLDIHNTTDPTSAIISYFLTYTVSIPSVSVIGGVKGLITLLILLALVYLVLYENKIAFYNPFLFLFKYKIYHFETTGMSQGYLILKVGGIDYKPVGKTISVQIDDFTFISKV